MLNHTKEGFPATSSVLASLVDLVRAWAPMDLSMLRHWLPGDSARACRRPCPLLPHPR